MFGYVPRCFTCPQTVTRPSSNRAWRRAAVLLACITLHQANSCLYLRVKNGNIVHCSRENKVRFHSASALGPAPNEVGPNAHLAAVHRLPTDWLAYDEMTRLHRSAQVKSCTVISPVTIAMFAGPAKLPLDAIKEAECGLHCMYTNNCYLFIRPKQHMEA